MERNRQHRDGEWRHPGRRLPLISELVTESRALKMKSDTSPGHLRDQSGGQRGQRGQRGQQNVTEEMLDILVVAERTRKLAEINNHYLQRTTESNYLTYFLSHIKGDYVVACDDADFFTAYKIDSRFPTCVSVQASIRIPASTSADVSSSADVSPSAAAFQDLRGPFGMLHEVEMATSWVPSLKMPFRLGLCEALPLPTANAYDPFEKYSFFVLDLPWPMSRRAVFLHSWWVNDLRSNNAHVLCFQAVDDKYQSPSALRPSDLLANLPSNVTPSHTLHSTPSLPSVHIRTPSSRTPSNRTPSNRTPLSRAPSSRTPSSRAPSSRAPSSPEIDAFPAFTGATSLASAKKLKKLVPLFVEGAVVLQRDERNGDIVLRAICNVDPKIKVPTPLVSFFSKDTNLRRNVINIAKQCILDAAAATQTERAWKERFKLNETQYKIIQSQLERIHTPYCSQ